MRRHYESGIRYQVMDGLGPRPTDSVLMRHYDALVDAAVAERIGGAAPAAASRAPSPAAARPAPASASPAAPAAAAPAAAASSSSSGDGGGFLGWLKRLFGG